MKTSSRLRIKAALDFDCPDSLARKCQDQINFCTARCAVETCVGALRCNRQKVLDDKPLPARANDRMSQNLLFVAETQQCMCDTTVTNIDLWRFDEALADILVPRPG